MTGSLLAMSYTDRAANCERGLATDGTRGKSRCLGHRDLPIFFLAIENSIHSRKGIPTK